VIFVRVVRWWLTGMLFFIPFVTKIYEIIIPWNSQLAALINRLDEMTIVVFFPVSIIKFYKDYRKKGDLDFRYLLLLIPILFLVICGVISGVLNGSTATYFLGCDEKNGLLNRDHLLGNAFLTFIEFLCNCVFLAYYKSSSMVYKLYILCGYDNLLKNIRRNERK